MAVVKVLILNKSVYSKKIILLCLLVFFLTSCAKNQSNIGDNIRHRGVSKAEEVKNPHKDKVHLKRSYAGSVISLREAAQAIVIFHPRIKQAIGNENSEEEMIAIAQSKYYPQVKGGVDTKKDNQNTTNNNNYTQELNIEINQVIYDFGKISNAVKSAEYGHLSAKTQTLMANEELINTAALAVLTIDRTTELSRLAKEQVDSVGSLSGLVDKRHKEGASNLSDVYQAKSRLDDVLSEELDIKSQHKRILRTLGLIIGQKNISNAVVGDLPESFITACSVNPEWQTIPEYKLAEIEAERALVELERAKSEELPTISFRGLASKPLNSISSYNKRNGNRHDVSVGINVSIPLYEGGALSSNKKVAESKIQSAEAKKSEVRLEIEQLIGESEEQLDSLNQRKNLLNQRIENLRNTKELYKKQYLELGTRTLVDLLNSEQEFHQAKVDDVNNHFEIIQTQINCLYQQGKLGEYLHVYSY